VGGTEAAGNGTHVGKFSKVTRDTLNLMTGAVTGAFEMTAANGDLVRGVYAGVMVFDAPPVPGGDPVGFSWVLEAEITGGTGRFVRATGRFMFEAQGTGVAGLNGVLDGEYSETFTGTIVY
jgi:hypothetical protein